MEVYTVAVLNSADDVIEALRTALEAAVEAGGPPGVMSEIVVGQPWTPDHVIDAVRQCLEQRIAL